MDAFVQSHAEALKHLQERGRLYQFSLHMNPFPFDPILVKFFPGLTDLPAELWEDIFGVIFNPSAVTQQHWYHRVFSSFYPCIMFSHQGSAYYDICLPNNSAYIG